MFSLGVLVVDDFRGNGYDVLVHGKRVLGTRRGMPVVFSSQGHAFLFWLGAGSVKDCEIVSRMKPDLEADGILDRFKKKMIKKSLKQKRS